MCSMLDVHAAWSARLCCGPSGSRRKLSVTSDVGGSKPAGTNSSAVMTATLVRRRARSSAYNGDHHVLVTISPRLTRWIKTNFPPGSAEPVLQTLRDLPRGVIAGQDPERIQASLVIPTGGDRHAFEERLALAKTDWRDALVGADLGNEDWPQRLDAVLGEA